MTRVLAAAVCLLALSVAHAGAFPDRPLKLVVPFPPGGASDIIGRIVADGAAAALGQPVVIENIGGAGGNIATAKVAQSAPDGYTLALCTIGTCAINMSLYHQPGYDIERDFTPVVLVGGVMNVFVANNTFPVRSVPELVAYAKAHPGQVNFGSSGIGTSNHLTPEWFKLITGLQMTHVPYKGAALALTDLMGSQVHFVVDNEPSVLPHIQSGRVRALAVTGAKRSPRLPNVPTMEEVGYRGFVVEPWFGLIAPAATPKAVVERLNAAVNQALVQPRTRQLLEQAAVHIIGGPPQRMSEQIHIEQQRWAQVIKANRIQVD